MKQQKQVEKKRLAAYIKEWSRPRDDLDCDDLQVFLQLFGID